MRHYCVLCKHSSTPRWKSIELLRRRISSNQQSFFCFFFFSSLFGALLGVARKTHLSHLKFERTTLCVHTRTSLERSHSFASVVGSPICTLPHVADSCIGRGAHCCRDRKRGAPHDHNGESHTATLCQASTTYDSWTKLCQVKDNSH